MRYSFAVASCLPILHDKPAPGGKTPKIRPSKMGQWRALVLIGVHVLVGLHIAHWLTTGSSVTPVEPSEAMAFSRASIVNAGLIFFAVTILLTAIFGRFFCGWGCHLVALQDFCRFLMLKVGIKPRAFKSRTLIWVPALAFVYMFLWPAIYRLYIGDSFAIRGTELTTSQFWATFPGWVIGALTFLTCGFACVYFLGAKGFCTYACPYGAIFAAADKLAPLRVRVTDDCEQCGHCTAVCSSNVRVHEEVRDWGMVVSPGCMKCGDCVSVCPKDALYFGVGTIPWLAKPRKEPAEPSARPRAPLVWGEEALLVFVFALTFLIVRGLYGLVPFLMSLGVAGVMAFFALTTWRLWRRRELDRSGLRLKRDGKLLPWGRVFVASMALLLLFFGHSAVVQIEAHLAARAYARTAVLQPLLLAPPGEPLSLPDWAKKEAQVAIDHLLKVEKWGLVPSLGTASKLAYLHAAQGANAESAARARQALERGELPGEMHQLLARDAIARSDFAAAVAQWRLAIDARPDLPQAYLALGIFFAQAGDISAGQEVFDRGLAVIGDSPQLFYNAALARALLGHTHDAIPLFEQALALDPRYLEARENLAGALASLGLFTASVEHYRQALEQAPGDASTRLLLARALLGEGEKEEAARELRKVLGDDALAEEARALLSNLEPPNASADPH